MICPRKCGVNRNAGELGYCRTDAGYHIGSICLHRGEEPAISGEFGICNIFFSHCNLQCLYCQNYQISRNSITAQDRIMTLDEVLNAVKHCLDQGAEAVGFVTPSHFIPHVRAIINALHASGYYPVTVYNSNGYDSVDMLRELEGLVHVYLPDFKYADPGTAGRFSGAPDYPEKAGLALKEMFRQKGSTLVIHENGQAVNGLIIRHLVLPGQAEDSVRVLQWIAEELSPSLYLSLMSQYYPTSCMSGHSVLSRTITEKEFNRVTEAAESLGFYRGWVQELNSSQTYRPDFSRIHPFER
jgi:putative pyruvate formate lyase activating enzyme